MGKKFIVETSARHVHVTQEVLEKLFGAGAQLHYKKELSQPGEYACEERVDVVGPKRTISRVTILGPCRAFTQVEVSLTDAPPLSCRPRRAPRHCRQLPASFDPAGEVLKKVNRRQAPIICSPRTRRYGRGRPADCQRKA